jgi:outer membrane receptor for ferrienterochelin and colicin
MRFWFSLFFLFAFCAVAFGQQGDAYFEIKKSSSLEIVLQKMANDFGLAFSYADRLAEEVQIAPGRWKTDSTDELLASFCEDNNLEFRISDQGDILLRARLQPKFKSNLPEQWLLKGRVEDFNGVAIADVAVYLDTLNLGTLTDAAGGFQFRIPDEYRDRKVLFQLIGYQRQEIPIAQLAEMLVVRLEQVSIDLEPITVTERIPQLQQLQADGAITLNTRNGMTPGSVVGKDIFRTIQLLPGLSAHDDLSAAIKIRGSEGDETLVVLDGIPIYRATHFFGVFSAINSRYIQQTTLYKNALPVAFGGKTGGMLLMESNGNLYNRLGLDLDLNLLTSSGVLRAPLGEKAALSISGRTTYTNAARNPIFDAFESETTQTIRTLRESLTRPDLLETLPTFQFYDLNARLVYRPNDQSSFDFNYYQSQDDFGNEYENRFRARLSLDRFVENVETFSNLEAWTNQGASLNFSHSFLEDWQLKTNLYYSKFENSGSVDSRLTRERPGQDIDLRSFENFQSNRIEDIGLKTLFSKPLDFQRNLDIGAEFIQHQNAFVLQEEDRMMLQNEAAAYEMALFNALPILNREDVFIELGNRFTFYSATDRVYWSPRLNIRYDYHQQAYLKGAFTRANQFVREFVYNNRLGQSLTFFTLSNQDEFPVGRSNNYMLGNHWARGPWSLDLELYKKDFWGLIEYAHLFQGFDPEEINPGRQREYAIFNGKGNTHGLDVMLSLNRTNYQGWLSYTWSKTLHEFRAIYRGATFPAQDDRRHQISWVNHYHWKALDLSATYVMASGRPFLDLAQLQKPEDLRQINPDQLFSRLPTYHRIDLGLSYPFSWKWAECSLGLSVFNVANRQNVKYQQFVYSIPYQRQEDGASQTLNQVIGNTTNLLNRTWNLSFSVQF